MTPHWTKRARRDLCPDVREVFLRSHRIVYRIAGNGIRVITVFEGHQRFPGDVDPDA